MHLLFKYLKHNWLFVLLIGYFGLSAIASILWGWDIGIPCLIKLTCGVECWGCGLSRAFIAIIQLDFQGAYEWNPLSFIVYPAISIYIVSDFLAFRRKFSKPS